MTDDQITAALDQLAAQREQITRLDAREATHYATLTGLLAGLTARTGPDPADEDPSAYQPDPAPCWWQLSPDDRQEPVARLRAWVSRSTGPATATWPPPSARAGPPTTCACTPWTSPPACGRSCTSSPAATRAAVRPGRIPGPHPARPGRPAGDRDHPLRPHPPPEHAMTDDPTLRQALAYARRGWPVFPCLPGQKVPATRHGYTDATTDEQQITGWFGRRPRPERGHRHRRPRPRRPGRRRPRPGRERVRRPRPAPLRRAAGRRVRLRPHPQRRPAHLLHRHRPAQRPPGRAPRGLPLGGRLRPGPALPGGRPPLPAVGDPRPRRHPELGARLPPLPSPPQRQRPNPARPRTGTSDTLARWLARQPEGNRNAGLYWAANRALETDPAADLSPLADAARQAGLGDQEISRPWTPPAGPARPAPNRPTTRPRR